MKKILKNTLQVACFILLVTAVLDLAGPRFTPTPHHFLPIRNVTLSQ